MQKESTASTESVQSAQQTSGGTKPLESPEELLHALGIDEMAPEEEFYYDLLDEIESAGGNVEAMRQDPMSSEGIDARFITEEIARRHCAVDYDRIVAQLKDLDGITGLPAHPKRIADLGGGVGIFSMWLAMRYPAGQVTVYDRSKNVLKWGRKWSQQLGLSNIEYVECSYEELAKSTPMHDCDLVLMSYGYDGYRYPGRRVFLDYEAPASTSPDTTSLDVAKAIDNLLSPQGVAYVSCGANARGHREFFEAVRSTELTIDWSNTGTFSLRRKDDTTVIVDHILLRRDYPQIARNAWEEARACYAMVTFREELTRLHPGLVESFSSFFEDGLVLIRIEGALDGPPVPPTVAFRVRVIQKSGLLLLEISHSDETKTGWMGSLADIDAMLKGAWGYTSNRHAIWYVDLKEIHSAIRPLWDKHAASTSGDLT